MKYEILQLDYENINVQRDHLMFMPWDYVNTKYGFNQWNYKKVYEGEVELKDTPLRVLEELYQKFNLHHPEDYTGHSISTSDVVILDGVKYYCDSYGWVNIDMEKRL